MKKPNAQAIPSEGSPPHSPSNPVLQQSGTSAPPLPSSQHVPGTAYMLPSQHSPLGQMSTLPSAPPIPQIHYHSREESSPEPSPSRTISLASHPFPRAPASFPSPPNPKFFDIDPDDNDNMADNRVDAKAGLSENFSSGSADAK
ncbi:hypothetical protein HD554DRAFT_2171694 [Boletus coccyginus]|nr:hypothetical protein HD554DRAFT_2171694 [Boletus coccyginus]